MRRPRIGISLSLDDRGQVSEDSTLYSQRLSFQVAEDGTALPNDYLPYLIDSLGGGRVALVLKGGTTVDTLGTTPDSGYTAELAIDLTKFGYPPGRGDGSVFFGLNLLDGDSFLPTSDSYGTRTWWFREYNGTCCPVWAYLDPTCLTVGVDEPDRLVQVIINLLNNAAKFTEKGRVDLYAAARTDGFVKVSVHDTGIGIPPGDIDKVFDKFHQVTKDDTLKDKPKGSGLGLAICRQIIERYGGRIWAESNIDGGSTFTFALPNFKN